jgi:hypothetical protein
MARVLINQEDIAMKYRNTLLIAVSCLAAAVAFGRAPQAPKGIAGKWGTDAAIAHLKDAAAPAAGGQSGHVGFEGRWH